MNSVSFRTSVLKTVPSKTYLACLLPTPTFKSVTKNVPSPPRFPKAAADPESIAEAAQKNLKSTLWENPGLWILLFGLKTLTFIVGLVTAVDGALNVADDELYVSTSHSTKTA